ncbi:MAG: phosphoribosyltransferase family protein [Saonia sp.]
MYKDRIDAGTQLAEKLLKFKEENVVILSIPRGGLPIGSIIAKALKAPLEIALIKKIGHPYHKEYAIGAVSLDDIVLTNAIGVTKSYIAEETTKIRAKLQLRFNQYYKHRSPENLNSRTIIIVDDGIATGNTIIATVQLASKQKPEKIIVAIPVAPISAIRKLKQIPEIDEVVCLKVPYYFRAVGQFYKEFKQVSDQEAIALLEETNHMDP